MLFVNISSHFVKPSFHFLEVEKFKILIKSDVCIFFFFCLAACVVGVISGKSSLNVRESTRVSHVF